MIIYNIIQVYQNKLQHKENMIIKKLDKKI
jgi:hypothetical protein